MQQLHVFLAIGLLWNEALRNFRNEIFRNKRILTKNFGYSYIKVYSNDNYSYIKVSFNYNYSYIKVSFNYNYSYIKMSSNLILLSMSGV